jgi:hypothetical protein
MLSLGWVARAGRRLLPGVFVAGVGLSVAFGQVALGVKTPKRPLGYLQGRTVRGRGSAAAALVRARREHLALAAKPRAKNLSGSWTAVGPTTVANPVYGAVSGRRLSSIPVMRPGTPCTWGRPAAEFGSRSTLQDL